MRTLFEEIECAVAMAEIIKLPWLARGDARSARLPDPRELFPFRMMSARTSIARKLRLQ